MEAERPLNRRQDDRYLIDEIPLEGIGTIVEISKNGLKIKKASGFVPEDPTMTFALSGQDIKTDVRWQDQTFLGLRTVPAFNDPAFFTQRIKRAKEILAPAQRKVNLENAVAQYEKEEGLISMINLCLEVHGPEPDIRKIGWYIKEISSLQEKEKPSGIKGGEENDKGEVQDKSGDEGKSIKEELIARAIGLQARDESGEIDIDFAIFILGLSKVCEIIQDHINKKFFQSETSRPLFENYETFNVLKSVVFKNLCRFFGLQDIQTEGSTLLSLETTGVDLLIKEGSGILDTYYKSPSRLYSEFSRTYEKTIFAVDPIQINQVYFKKDLKSFGELFNGYVLAHHTLNPHYFSSEDLKLSLSKNGLIFSALACLTFLAVQFLMDKDRESGFALAKRLKGRGMDDRKIDQFLDQSVSDTKTILQNLKLKGTLSKPLLPDGLIPIESYLGRDIRFEYLVQSFRNFDHKQVKRMALRYEDAVYAHFILGKLMNSENFDLNSKTVCVVPCRNISSDQWYIKDFDYFDLIVFKEINKLPASHLGVFLKLWGTFEGHIIATFSHLEVLDYTNPPLHKIFKNYIVDFPSCFLNDAVYGKMIDHTCQYLQPYLGDQLIDRKRYLPGVLTMNHIKADILLTKEII
jgi:hypothetical protein